MYRSNPSLYKLILMVPLRSALFSWSLSIDIHSANPPPIAQDIHMPVMDGVTCTRHIREFENAEGIEQKVPIIALTGTPPSPILFSNRCLCRSSCQPLDSSTSTADTTPRQRRICIEAGCNEYLSKPINYPLLVDTVKRFLQPLGQWEIHKVFCRHQYSFSWKYLKVFSCYIFWNKKWN